MLLAAIETWGIDHALGRAAQSLPSKSWADPTGTMRINLDGTLHLLEAMRADTKRRPRLMLAGSSSQYASTMDGTPIGEDAPVDPGSPYAVSKLAVDVCADRPAQ